MCLMIMTIMRTDATRDLDEGLTSGDPQAVRAVWTDCTPCHLGAISNIGLGLSCQVTVSCRVVDQ